MILKTNSTVQGSPSTKAADTPNKASQHLVKNISLTNILKAKTTVQATSTSEAVDLVHQSSQHSV